MSSNDDSLRKKITKTELEREGLAALLEKGLSPNALVVSEQEERFTDFIIPSKRSNTTPLLFFYVGKRDVNNLRLLIEKGVNLDIRGFMNDHILHHLATLMMNDVHAQMFELLIKQKIDLNAQNRSGLTPIMFLFSIISTRMPPDMDRMLDVIKKLVEAHADLNKVVKRREEDVTAISLAESALFSLRKENHFFDEEAKKTEQKFSELIQFLIQESKKQALGQQRVPGSAPGSRFAAGDAKSEVESKESEKGKDKDKDKDKDEKPKRKPS